MGRRRASLTSTERRNCIKMIIPGCYFQTSRLRGLAGAPAMGEAWAEALESLDEQSFAVAVGQLPRPGQLAAVVVAVNQQSCGQLNTRWYYFP